MSERTPDSDNNDLGNHLGGNDAENETRSPDLPAGAASNGEVEGEDSPPAPRKARVCINDERELA